MGWIRRLVRVLAWETERTQGLTAEERWVRDAILRVRDEERAREGSAAAG